MPPIAGSTTLARVVNPHGDEGGQRGRDCRTVVVLRDLGLDHGDPAAAYLRGSRQRARLARVEVGHGHLDGPRRGFVTVGAAYRFAHRGVCHGGDHDAVHRAVVVDVVGGGKRDRGAAASAWSTATLPSSRKPAASVMSALLPTTRDGQAAGQASRRSRTTPAGGRRGTV